MCCVACVLLRLQPSCSSCDDSNGNNSSSGSAPPLVFNPWVFNQRLYYLQTGNLRVDDIPQYVADRLQGMVPLNEIKVIRPYVHIRANGRENINAGASIVSIPCQCGAEDCAELVVNQVGRISAALRGGHLPEAARTRS